MSTRTDPDLGSDSRPTVRLSPSEIRGIRKAVLEVYEPEARIRVFGSRADPGKKGGDIDLLLEVDPGRNDVSHELRAQGLLEKYLGEQKIDLIVADRDSGEDVPIVRIARQKGILL